MKTELTELRKHLDVYFTAERDTSKWHRSKTYLVRFYAKYGTISPTDFQALVR